MSRMPAHVVRGAAEHVEVELAKYKEEYDRVTRITGQLSSDDLLRYTHTRESRGKAHTLTAPAELGERVQ